MLIPLCKKINREKYAVGKENCEILGAFKADFANGQEIVRKKKEKDIALPFCVFGVFLTGVLFILPIYSHVKCFIYTSICSPLKMTRPASNKWTNVTIVQKASGTSRHRTVRCVFCYKSTPQTLPPESCSISPNVQWLKNRRSLRRLFLKIRFRRQAGKSALFRTDVQAKNARLTW